MNAANSNRKRQRLEDVDGESTTGGGGSAAADAAARSGEGERMQEEESTLDGSYHNDRGDIATDPVPFCLRDPTHLPKPRQSR